MTPTTPYVLVPREPTEAMEAAAVHAAVNLAQGRPWFPFAWRAAIAAAPAAPAAPPVEHQTEQPQTVCTGSDPAPAICAAATAGEVGNGSSGEGVRMRARIAELATQIEYSKAESKLVEAVNKQHAELIRGLLRFDSWPLATEAGRKVVDVLAVVPLGDHPLSPADGEGPESAMSGWITGDIKPHHDGPYLRQFAEGEALSWWYDGQWNGDSFFAGPSDIQDAPWRGFDAGALAAMAVES
jgi:hypothetical protein